MGCGVEVGRVDLFLNSGSGGGGEAGTAGGPDVTAADSC